MYNLLIVDDEVYAVEALMKGIDWSKLGYSGIYSAYDADDAMEIMRTVKIDTLLCDIEMPGSNGLELVDWVNEQYPTIVSVFLTGHADFSYAQQAIRLGSFEYVLKPVNYDHLQKIMLKVLDKLEELKKAEQFDETYQTHVKLWEKQKPLLTERFWQDILAQRHLPTAENLKQMLPSYNLSFDPNTTILPILLSVELWNKEFNLRDEEIMEYALRNAAAELFLHSLSGDIIQDRNGIHFILIYLTEGKGLEMKDLQTTCQEYIEICARLFYCSLSCYVGSPVFIRELSQSYRELLDLEASNIANMKVVQFQQEQELNCPDRTKAPVFIDWEDWAVLFELGKKAELMNRIEAVLTGLQDQADISETIDVLYHSVLHMVYEVSYKRGWSVKEFIGSKKWLGEASATRSIAQFRMWAAHVISAGADYIHSHEGNSSSLIEKIKQYVQSHLKDATREGIASYVYLNSAYLSRLYKKETGQTLMDYIIYEKMTQAKIMLTESNIKISDICEAMGYDNFSHFGKMFKKQVGIPPQEYRKRYQNMGK
ncbi:response regulator [Paenibacillus psychroresistens]|uniref:Response regulator n=1 Tax=Paenibacillus psychroresistens TaxID=1778678 RepID=A0A6B8RVE6_9BACL|nr:response regulator [Paenibacillus psychroresistens]QGQ99403.1 response regulator [Paenibacillus psychroresistens]